MVENREPNDDIFENSQPEPEIEMEEEALGEPEPELAAAVTETPEKEIAQVDIVTANRRMVMSAPVKEFDEFKSSFKAMMVAFGNFIEAAGLEIGKDETGEKLAALSGEIETLREQLAAEEEKIGDQMVTKADLENYKVENDEKMTKESEDYIRREEFERFRQAIREVI